MDFQIELAKILPVRPDISIIDPLPAKLNALTCQHGAKSPNLAFFLGDDLKRWKLPFHLFAFAFRTNKFFLFILGKCQDQGKFTIAFFTYEFIYGHCSSPFQKVGLFALPPLCTWCFSCLYTKVDAVSESDHAYTLLLSLRWSTIDRIDHDYSSTHILIIRPFQGSTNRSGGRFCQTGSTSFPVPSLSLTVAALPGQEIAAL